jgi:hypothetical protein
MLKRCHALMLLVVLYGSGVAQVSVNDWHFFSGNVFQVYEDDKPINKYVSLTIDFSRDENGVISGHCYIVYVLINKSTSTFSLEAHTASIVENTLSVIAFDSSRVVFDVSVSRLLSDRQLRVACDRIALGGPYNVKVSGIWPNVFSSGSVKVDWKQREYVDLPFKRLSKLELF